MGLYSMAKISAGNGNIIEIFGGGYKTLHCPDDEPGKKGKGIGRIKI